MTVLQLILQNMLKPYLNSGKNFENNQISLANRLSENRNLTK
jgi:hypothetical protein